MVSIAFCQVKEISARFWNHEKIIDRIEQYLKWIEKSSIMEERKSYKFLLFYRLYSN